VNKSSHDLSRKVIATAVPRENATVMAIALRQIVVVEDWGRELGRPARQRAEQYFSLEVIGQ
jgi:hypothetical protein